MDSIQLTIMMAVIIGWSLLIQSQQALLVTCGNNQLTHQYNLNFTVQVKLNGCNSSDTNVKCNLMSDNPPIYIALNVSSNNQTYYYNCTLIGELSLCYLNFTWNLNCTTNLTSQLYIDVNCHNSNVTVLWSSPQEFIASQISNITDQATCSSLISETTPATSTITQTTGTSVHGADTVGDDNGTSSTGIIVGVIVSLVIVAVIVCVVIFLHRKYDLSRLLHFLRKYRNPDPSAQRTLDEPRKLSTNIADQTQYSSLQSPVDDTGQVNYSYSSLNSSSSNNHDDRRPTSYVNTIPGTKQPRGDSIFYDNVTGNNLMQHNSSEYLDLQPDDLYLNSDLAVKDMPNVDKSTNTMYQYVTNSLPGKEQTEDRSSNVYYNEMADNIYTNE